MKSNCVINEFVTLYKADEKVNTDSSTLLSGKLNALTLNVNLQGTTRYKSLRSDYDIIFKQNHTLIDLVNEEDGIIYRTKNNHKKSINLVIKQEYLKNILLNDYLLDDIQSFFTTKVNVKNISYKKNHYKTQTLAYEIFNSPYKNNLEKLHVESKVLDLIYTEFSNLSKREKINKNTEIKFSKKDKEAIYYARKILLNNLSNPPTMKKLAKMVAINDLKLKIGFHKFFNDTPYNLSLETRLQKAKVLLKSSELNVSEIANEVGYKYNSNFTKAFIKRFGIKPKDVMKSRNYYY